MQFPASFKTRRALLFATLAVIVLALGGTWAGKRALERTGLKLTAKESALAEQLHLQDKAPLEFFKDLTGWMFASLAFQYGDSPKRVTGTIEETLTLLSAACGYRDHVTRRFAQYLGLETRRVNFFNVGVQVGHSATEVRIDGLWRFFDATTGVYFAAPDDPATPISYQEAQDRYPRVVIMRAQATSPFPGQWVQQERFPFEPVTDPLVRSPRDGKILASLEDVYFRAGQLDRSDTRYFPVLVNAERVPAGGLGKVDGSGADVWAGFFEIGQSKQYVPIVGTLGASTDDDSHYGLQFIFTSDAPRLVELTLTALKSATFRYELNHVQPQYFTAESRRIDVREQGGTTTYAFPVYPPVSYFYLSNAPEQQVVLDAITWSMRPEQREAAHQ
jgi:hypothetical protein